MTLKINFAVKLTANIEVEQKMKPELIITRYKTNLLLELDLFNKLGIERNTGRGTNIRHVLDDKDAKELKKKFKKLFTEYHTVNRTEVTLELESSAKLIQQKSKPIPKHLQPAVEKDKNMRTQTGQVGKVRNTD